MRLSLKNMSFNKKIILLATLVIIMFAVTIFTYLIPLMQEKWIDSKKEKLKDIVEVSISIVRKLHHDHTAGRISLAAAKERALSMISDMRYGEEKKDYLWVNDFHPRMLMHPYVQKLVGTDLTDYKDPTGKRLFVEMVNICKKQGEGYVDYMWQYKDQSTGLVPKISYVKSFPEWKWIIGTGIYIEDVRSELMAVLKNIGIILGAIIVFALLTSLLIARRITRPVSLIIGRLKELANAEGDLTMRIPVDSSDEMGEISSELNRFLDQFEHIVSDIMNTANKLASAIHQIDKGNEDLAQRTSEQVSSLEEIASTIEETSSVVSQNTEKFSQADVLAEKSRTIGNEVNEIVGGMITNINTMESSSREIGDIISLINEISLQTNLLALNAAIEAARAGSQGRGFAVVAGEVRNLAQRSREASERIEKLVSELIDRIGATTEGASRSSKVLKQIVDAIIEVKKTVSEIAFSGEEMRRGISEINTALIGIDSTSQQNAALVEQTTAATREISFQSEKLLEMMKRFKTGRNELKLIQ